MSAARSILPQYNILSDRFRPTGLHWDGSVASTYGTCPSLIMVPAC